MTALDSGTRLRLPTGFGHSPDRASHERAQLMTVAAKGSSADCVTRTDHRVTFTDVQPIFCNAADMTHQPIKPTYVTGPLGEPLTLETLPPPNPGRWIARRKAEVVSAVEGGLLTIEEACERYDLSLQEFVSWQRSVDRAGLPGLRVTKVQHYRTEWERRGCR